MANFPALIPADAIITPGAIPATVVQGYDGSTVTTTADTLATGDLLTLPFQNLSEAEANSVRAHQASQQGRPFAFDAITLAPALSQPGYAWVYASAPQQEDIRSVAGSELYFLTCAFRAVRVRVAAAGGYLEYPADTHSGRGRDDTPRGSFVFGAQANGSKCSCCASAYSFYVYCINGY